MIGRYKFFVVYLAYLFKRICFNSEEFKFLVNVQAQSQFFMNSSRRMTGLLSSY